MVENNPSIRRRRLLQATAIAGTIGGLSSYTSVGVRARSTCPTTDPNNQWDDHANYENAKGKNEGIYLSTDIGCIGAEYEDEVWKYKFKQSTVGRSEEYPSGDSRAALKRQEVGVTEGTTYNLAGYYGDCFIGARPDLNSGNGYDYYDAAITIAEAAVASINSYTSYGVTAATLTKDLMFADSGAGGSDYEHHQIWDYYDNSYSVHDEVSNYCFWESWADGEDYFDVKTRLESMYGNNPELLFSFKIYNGYSPQRVGGSSTYSTRFGTELLSYSTESKPGHDWQVEKIPPEKIRDRVRAGGIFVNMKNIRRHEKNNQPLYWAHNPPVDMISVSKSDSP